MLINSTINTFSGRGSSPSDKNKRALSTPSPLREMGGAFMDTNNKKAKLDFPSSREGSSSPLPEIFLKADNDSYTLRGDGPSSPLSKKGDSSSILRDPRRMPWEPEFRAALKPELPTDDTLLKPMVSSRLSFHTSDWGSQLEHTPINKDNTPAKLSDDERRAKDNVAGALEVLGEMGSGAKTSSVASNSPKDS